MRTLFNFFVVTILLISCSNKVSLHYVLKSAGANRPQLEYVLDYYKKDDPEKLAAARFLILNMPAHYSYKNKDAIIRYYEFAESVLASDMTPEKQRDTLLFVSDSLYRDLPKQTVPDAQIISSEFLIHTIDLAYNQWKNCSWAIQVTFEDFLEYLLPYKATELQELDYWRDSLYFHFSDGLNNLIVNDVEYNTTMGIAEMIRNEVQNKVNRHGLYTRSGLPLLNSYLLPRQTFGDIPDYVLLSILAFRSTGVPVVQDETPVGSRGTAAEGSVAEVAFFDERGNRMEGLGIANAEAGQDAIERAYDNSWLTNFEINQPDGNWVGMDFLTPKTVASIRVVPRSDDNDVHTGQDYELCYLNSHGRWESLGRKTAVDNSLQFDSVPNNCLLWLINHTCGMDERPFVYFNNHNIQWW